MRKTKRYQKKGHRTRRKTKRHTRRRMKGGTVSPFGSDFSVAFDTLKYGVNKAVGIGMGTPVEVPPGVKGGDNPLPYKQLGPAE